jgi:hypothetical protein
MPIISEIISIITTITEIRRHRQETHDACEILCTTLELHLPVLRRIDTLLGDDESTAPARIRLRKVVVDAQTIIEEYHKSRLQIHSQYYNRNFSQLIKLFQVGISSLTLSATFPPEQRRLINQYVEDRPSAPAADAAPGVYAITTSSSSSLSEEQVRVASDLVDYKNLLERPFAINLDDSVNPD